MCGIVGYTGKKNAKNIAILSLKNLEYRGYDSSGIAIYENGKFNTYKATGKIANLEKDLEKYNLPDSNIAIAHTRWATHGVPNTTNAHPHKHGVTTLVHNGIIENYLELKKMLEKKGIKFYSQTDSEVAVALINYFYEENLNKGNNDCKAKIIAITKACEYIKGSYAFAIVFDDDKKAIYGTRKDSPLLIGVGNNENFIASDISAFLDYTNKYILINHNEYVKISDNEINIYNKDFNMVDYEIKEANLQLIDYKKNGYEHFMLKEIHEQPFTVFNVFKRFFDGTEKNYDKINLSKYRNIDIVACGSAMHAGLVGKYLFERYLKIPTNVEIASEYRYKKLLPGKDTLVILISQSGETADTIAALRMAKENNASTLAICNVLYSTISHEADVTIHTHAGPEIAVATTKGYSTQVATLATITLNELKRKNMLQDIKLELLNKNLTNILETFENVISNNKDYLEVAEKIKNENDLFFIGRGLDYYLCMEGSLKLKEISYMHSEAYSAGELKHGTISLIKNSTPVIAIATDEELILKTISNVEEVKSRGAYTIFITTDSLKEKYNLEFNDVILTVPTLHPFLQSISIIILLQLIAYETAKLRGCDIDKPKNLAKSVTVE